MGKLALTLLSALTFAGCAHSNALRGRAAFELACAEAAVEINEERDVYRATGCGRETAYAYRTVKMESRCTSATHAPPAPADRDVPSGMTPLGAALNRGVVDLACREDALAAQTFDSGAIGVRGCGRRIAYVCRQRFWRYWCDADSPVLSDL